MAQEGREGRAAGLLNDAMSAEVNETAVDGEGAADSFFTGEPLFLTGGGLLSGVCLVFLGAMVTGSVFHSTATCLLNYFVRASDKVWCGGVVVSYQEEVPKIGATSSCRATVVLVQRHSYRARGGAR